jgi:hypothetical protein
MSRKGGKRVESRTPTAKLPQIKGLTPSKKITPKFKDLSPIQLRAKRRSLLKNIRKKRTEIEEWEYKQSVMRERFLEEKKVCALEKRERKS